MRFDVKITFETSVNSVSFEDVLGQRGKDSLHPYICCDVISKMQVYYAEQLPSLKTFQKNGFLDLGRTSTKRAHGCGVNSVKSAWLSERSLEDADDMFVSPALDY